MIGRRRRLVVVVLTSVVVLSLVSCQRGDDSEALVLDGSPRRPDVEGVVRDVTFSSLTLDDGRRFTIDRSLQSFSTYTLESLPVLGRKDQYVHLGVDEDKVRWIASIGPVVKGSVPSVFYTGTVLRIEERQVIFRDGTVLRSRDTVPAEVKGAFVVAEIDPSGRVVRRLTPG